MELLALYDEESMGKIITLNFLAALANNHLLHKEIDKVYSKNKLEFYEASSHTNILNSKLIHTYPSAETERIIKLAGILNWSVLQDNMDLIERFLLIGFSEVWDYFERNSEILLPDFLPSIYKRQKEMKKSNKQEKLDKYSVLFWLCFACNKSCELGPLETDVRTSFNRAYIAELGHQILESITTKYQHNIKELYPVYRLTRRKFKGKTLDLLFRDIALDEFRTQGLSAANSSNHEKQRREEITKYSDVFLNLVSLFGINGYALGQCELTIEELNQIFATYYLSRDEIALPENERDIYLVAALYFKTIIKEYQNTRQAYLLNAREENCLNTLMIENGINEKEQLVHGEKSKFITEVDQLKAKVDQLQNEVLRCGRKATIMERELEIAKLNTKELIALRELMLNQSQSSTVDENEPDVFQKCLDVLMDKDCVIIGGHPNWVKKIKENLPTFTYLDADSLHKDLRYLGHKEHVFINTDYISHDLYYKVMAQMTNKKIKLNFLRGTSVPGSLLAMGKVLEQIP